MISHWIEGQYIAYAPKFTKGSQLLATLSNSVAHDQ